MTLRCEDLSNREDFQARNWRVEIIRKSQTIDPVLTRLKCWRKSGLMDFQVKPRKTL